MDRKQSDSLVVSRVGVAVLVGGIVALVGTYWDDVWHTDRGRDAFAAPPHLVLYAGVAVILAAVGVWAFVRYRRSGVVWSTVRQPELTLPLLGAALIVIAAPIDEGWHRAFGRDAVLWSPPHTLGIVGLLAVGAGMLLAQQHLAGPLGRWLRAATAALVIGAAMVPVMEYETDVPQFALLWYLPVLIVGVAFSFATIQRAVPDRWAATRAAGLYTLARLGVLGFLAALGGSTAIVPPILVPALVDDLCARRGWPRPLRAAATSTATAVAYVLYHRLAPRGLDLVFLDAVIGASLGAALAWAVYRSFQTSTGKMAAATLVVAAVAILPAGAAWAHDPGQGPEVARTILRASSEATRTHVVAIVDETDVCQSLEPVRLTTRRAGRELHAPLARTQPCRFEASITLPSGGAWFLYTELRREGQPLEAWIPFDPATVGPEVKDTALYRPSPTSSPPIEYLGGGALYLINIAMLIAVVRTYRRRATAGQAKTRPPEP